MVLKYVKKADYSFYKGEKDNFSMREGIEVMKKNYLIINNENHSYLRLIFVKISKIY